MVAAVPRQRRWPAWDRRPEPREYPRQTPTASDDATTRGPKKPADDLLLVHGLPDVRCPVCRQALHLRYLQREGRYGFCCGCPAHTADAGD